MKSLHHSDGSQESPSWTYFQKKNQRKPELCKILHFLRLLEFSALKRELSKFSAT